MSSRTAILVGVGIMLIIALGVAAWVVYADGQQDVPTAVEPTRSLPGP
jgi:hypothetical protein